MPQSLAMDIHGELKQCQSNWTLAFFFPLLNATTLWLTWKRTLEWFQFTNTYGTNYMVISYNISLVKGSSSIHISLISNYHHTVLNVQYNTASCLRLDLADLLISICLHCNNDELFSWFRLWSTRLMQIMLLHCCFVTCIVTWQHNIECNYVANIKVANLVSIEWLWEAYPCLGEAEARI